MEEALFDRMRAGCAWVAALTRKEEDTGRVADARFAALSAGGPVEGADAAAYESLCEQWRLLSQALLTYKKFCRAADALLKRRVVVVFPEYGVAVYGVLTRMDFTTGMPVLEGGGQCCAYPEITKADDAGVCWTAGPVVLTAGVLDFVMSSGSTLYLGICGVCSGHAPHECSV